MAEGRKRITGKSTPSQETKKKRLGAKTQPQLAKWPHEILPFPSPFLNYYKKILLPSHSWW